MGEHKRQFISGVAYTAAAKYAGVAVQLAIGAVLSRLLPPSEFGVIGIATIVITFLTTFSDMGIAPAIVQYKDLSKRDLDNLYSFTCWAGLALAALFFASSWSIARFYDSPKLAPVCQVLSLQLLLASANMAPNALMYRDKRFRFIAIRMVATQIATGVVAVIMAYRLPTEYKIYALTAQPVLSALIVFVINLREYPLRLRLSLGGETLRKVLGYSTYQFLFNLINYFSRNLDKLVIGKYLDMARLGFYNQSYRLMMMPLQNITSVLSSVMHPVFSEMQDDRQGMLSRYMRVVRLLAAIGFPLSVVMLFGGREIMLLYSGPQWVPAVASFKIFSIVVGVQIVLSSSGPIFQAAGDTRSLFFSGLFSAATNVAGMLIPLLTFGTIESVAWGLSASFTLNFVVSYILMYRVTFRQPMRGFWLTLRGPVVLSLAMAALLWPLDVLTAEWNMILSLGLKCAVAGGMWLVWVQRSGMMDITGRIKKLLRR